MKRRATDSQKPSLEYMSLFITMSKAIAMWPLETKGFSAWLVHRALNIFITSVITVTLLSLLLKLLVDFEDMDGIATVIDFLTVYASGVFRYTYVFWRGEKYQKLIATMYSTFAAKSLNTQGEKLSMTYFHKIGTRISVIYYFGSIIFILQMIVTPIFVFISTPDMTRIPLIFESWVPYKKGPMHYVAFVIQATSWLLMGYHYLLADAFWYMLIILTIGQLRIIAHTYHTLVPGTDDKRLGDWSPDTRRAFGECVKLHQNVRRFIKDTEELLWPIVIVDFMHGVLSITFLLLDITIAVSKSDWVKVFHLFEYFMVSVVHMFAFNFLGNELAIQEEKIAFAFYSIPWYTSPKSAKSALCMTTAAGRNPCRLTGGKFFYLSLEFFVGAMRTIFSYFMVLLQLRNEDMSAKKV